MKANRGEIERALDRPGDTIRCYLLYGPDEAGSRALADRLGKAMGADAERIDLEGTTLAKEPARLPDEAASTSLFGGPRWIRVSANGDEVADAVDALLEASQAGNPVAVVAGALKPSSRLLKAALASPAVMACASYLPEARDAGPLVSGMAAPLGLRVAPDVARRIFEAAAGDRAVIAQEIEKIACFLDAGDGAQREVDMSVLDAIGAGEGETDSAALISATLTGNIRGAVEELKALGDAGEDGIPLIRATLRKLLQLAPLRADADENGLAAATKAVFFKEKDAVTAELQRWSSGDLARLVERVTIAQAQLLESNAIGAVTASQELLTIARQAARNR